MNRLTKLAKPIRWARTKLRKVPYEVRAQLYKWATAGSTSLVTAGTFTEDEVQIALLILAGVLGVSAGALAAANTPSWKSQTREFHRTLEQGR